MRGERRRPTRSNRAKVGQGLAVAVGGVLDDGQLGGVPQDLVKGEGGVAFGGDDDLGAVGGPVLGSVSPGAK